MDQDAFRNTYREVNERTCVFEKSVQTGLCRCSRSHTICIAERQGIGCETDEAQEQCQELLNTLRHQSRFALKVHDEHVPMAHSSALRVQMGGLRGLYAALNQDGSNPTMIADIFALVSEAKDRFKGFERLPFQIIIQHIAAYKGRHAR